MVHGSRREPGRGLVFTAFLLALGLLTGPGAGQEGNEEKPTGDALCWECHGDLRQAFEQTPHGRQEFQQHPRAAAPVSCLSCHRDALPHAEEGDTEVLPPLDLAAQQSACLACHDSRLHSPSLGSGAHSGSGVACSDCHSMHTVPAAATPLLSEEPLLLCSSCHKSEQASFRKPYAHRLGRGGMECFSCHDPHGGRGRDSLTMDRLGEGPCLSCHSEKRGPFVFSHVTGVAGDCLSCHEAHGSSNPKRLIRTRVDQLCLECHSLFPPTTLGSQPPSFHDLRSPRFRECTTCHVAVHGSNSSPMLLE
jgi:DmsE family decaheme c-type cytochrome